jgi:4-amino-4-deoxy-L-arabinose transferase-like glycosyltransferase
MCARQPWEWLREPKPMSEEPDIVTKPGRHAVAIFAVWLVLVVSGLVARPAVPPDETRYLAVAWEMWHSGDLVLPTLNGVPYSHKPPLLFWLMHLGWAVLGVSAAWARLVPGLAALAALALTWRLARLLWPAMPAAAPLATWILTGSVAFAAYTSVLLVDMLLVAAVLVAICGLVGLDRRSGRRWWLLTAAGVTLGLLAKGPVVLLFTLPPVLLGPLWRQRETPSPGRGGGAAAGAMVCGIVAAVPWAVAAAERGGEAYRQAVLWGQTVSRLVQGVTHPRPWYAYLLLLPLTLLPWLLWPTLWRAGRSWRRPGGDRGVRLGMAWAGPALLLLILVPDKQPHYLLPLLPAVALVAGAALARGAGTTSRWALLPPAAAMAVPGLVVATAALVDPARLPAWADRLSPLWGAVAVAVACGPLLVRRPPPGTAVAALATAAVGVVVVLHLAFATAGGEAFDVRPVAAEVAVVQGRGEPVAHVGPYHGQYHFYGRLRRPLEVIEPGEIEVWSAANPDGLVVVYLSDWRLEGAGTPVLQRPYRGDTGVSLWRRGALLAERAGGTPRWERSGG